MEAKLRREFSKQLDAWQVEREMSLSVIAKLTEEVKSRIEARKEASKVAQMLYVKTCLALCIFYSFLIPMVFSSTDTIVSKV